MAFGSNLEQSHFDLLKVSQQFGNTVGGSLKYFKTINKWNNLMKPIHVHYTSQKKGGKKSQFHDALK